MTTPLDFHGLCAVLPTSFNDAGELDLAGVAALVEAHLAAGASGLTVLGVMGEAAELSEAERSEVVSTVFAHAADTPLTIGITGSSTDVIGGRSKIVASLGASAVMVSPTASVSLADAVDAASAAGLPIIIQDYPAGSGVTITLDELEAAVQSNKLVGAVKVEAPPTGEKIASIRRRLPDLPILGGLGGLLLVDELRAGAVGSMTGFPLPERVVAIIQDFTKDPAASESEFYRLLPLMRYEAFPPSSLAARKEVWRLRGVIRSAYCRRPGAVIDEETRAGVARALEVVIGLP